MELAHAHFRRQAKEVMAKFRRRLLKSGRCSESAESGGSGGLLSSVSDPLLPISTCQGKLPCHFTQAFFEHCLMQGCSLQCTRDQDFRPSFTFNYSHTLTPTLGASVFSSEKYEELDESVPTFLIYLFIFIGGYLHIVMLCHALSMTLT